ncbi:ATP-binding protein (plasmid) [Actinomadura graeca]|uniref:ATP-binding protein n=2 Tax=Actinomadura graeca TaxID=2750812 RepID=A0ABX8R7K6_9ACTN|nr:ATP-binding protein [Actinomadura graeca]
MPGTAGTVGRARHNVSAELELWALPAELVDDVVLTVSELVTNAVRHTHSGRPGGAYALVVTAEADGVRVAVADQGAVTEPRVPVPACDSATGGRGLCTVARLGSLGWEGGPAGRRVWALLPYPPRDLDGLPR